LCDVNSDATATNNESADLFNSNRTVSVNDRNNDRQWRKDKQWMNKWNTNSTIPCRPHEDEELEGADNDSKPCRHRHHHHQRRRHHHSTTFTLINIFKCLYHSYLPFIFK